MTNDYILQQSSDCDDDNYDDIEKDVSASKLSVDKIDTEEASDLKIIKTEKIEADNKENLSIDKQLMPPPPLLPLKSQIRYY